MSLPVVAPQAERTAGPAQGAGSPPGHSAPTDRKYSCRELPASVGAGAPALGGFCSCSRHLAARGSAPCARNAAGLAVDAALGDARPREGGPGGPAGVGLGPCASPAAGGAGAGIRRTGSQGGSTLCWGGLLSTLAPGHVECGAREAALREELRPARQRDPHCVPPAGKRAGADTSLTVLSWPPGGPRAPLALAQQREQEGCRLPPGRPWPPVSSGQGERGAPGACSAWAPGSVSLQREGPRGREELVRPRQGQQGWDGPGRAEGLLAVLGPWEAPQRLGGPRTALHPPTLCRL